MQSMQTTVKNKLERMYLELLGRRPAAELLTPASYGNKASEYIEELSRKLILKVGKERAENIITEIYSGMIGIHHHTKKIRKKVSDETIIEYCVRVYKDIFPTDLYEKLISNPNIVLPLIILCEYIHSLETGNFDGVTNRIKGFIGRFPETAIILDKQLFISLYGEYPISGKTYAIHWMKDIYYFQSRVVNTIVKYNMEKNTSYKFCYCTLYEEYSRDLNEEFLDWVSTNNRYQHGSIRIVCAAELFAQHPTIPYSEYGLIDESQTLSFDEELGTIKDAYLKCKKYGSVKIISGKSAVDFIIERIRISKPMCKIILEDGNIIICSLESKLSGYILPNNARMKSIPVRTLDPRTHRASVSETDRYFSRITKIKSMQLVKQSSRYLYRVRPITSEACTVLLSGFTMNIPPKPENEQNLYHTIQSNLILPEDEDATHIYFNLRRNAIPKYERYPIQSLSTKSPSAICGRSQIHVDMIRDILLALEETRVRIFFTGTYETFNFLAYTNISEFALSRLSSSATLLLKKQIDAIKKMAKSIDCNVTFHQSSNKYYNSLMCERDIALFPDKSILALATQHTDNLISADDMLLPESIGSFVKSAPSLFGPRHPVIKIKKLEYNMLSIQQFIVDTIYQLKINKIWHFAFQRIDI